MATIKRKATAASPDTQSIMQWAGELLTAKAQQKFFKTRQDTVTKRLKAVIEEAGYTDENGHIWMDLPEAIDGVPKLKMERKVSQNLREEKAEEILRAKGLYDSCTKTLVVLDDDEIMAAHYRGDLTEDDIDTMFPKVVSYALLTPIAK